MIRRQWLFNISITFWFVVGCSSHPNPAPVEEYRQPPSTKVGVHTVSSGDTLYSIAWRYDLDYKKLALANGISRSYRIYPGQQLLLTDLDRRIERYQKIKNRKKAIPSKAKKTHTKAVVSKPPVRLKKASKSNKKTTKEKSNTNPSTWVWPAEGRLGQTFNSNKGLNKGIDLHGKLGDSVRAAAAGNVVYSGNGLRGYGLLVIVKHSEKYLSAYAHNNQILVKEGDKVTQGQKIAELGSTGSDRVKLHFEIRFNGKPVDPLTLLPRKK